MSAVTEITGETGTGLTRLEQLEKQLHALHEREQELVVFLRDAPDREAQLRAEWFEKTPTKLPDANSPAGRAAAKSRAAQTDLDNCRKNIGAVSHLIEEQRRQQREELTRKIARDAKRYRQGERDAVQKAGETLSQLFDNFCDYRDAVQALNTWRETAAASVGISGDDLDSWRTSDGRHTVEPITVDFPAFVKMLTDVMFDPFGEGYRDNSGRSHDSYGELVALTPNLTAMRTRSSTRRELSGADRSRSSLERATARTLRNARKPTGEAALAAPPGSPICGCVRPASCAAWTA